MANKLEIYGRAIFRPEKRTMISTPDFFFTTEPATKDVVVRTQVIGVAEENIDVGDINSVGYIMARNVGVNVVNIGVTGAPSITLAAGAFCMFPPLGTMTAISIGDDSTLELYIFPAP